MPYQKFICSGMVGICERTYIVHSRKMSISITICFFYFLKNKKKTDFFVNIDDPKKLLVTIGDSLSLPINTGMLNSEDFPLHNFLTKSFPSKD